MFRRLPTSLPKDPTFPADLKELGYFVNDNDQIRMIRNPDEKFLYAIDKNERVNEMQKEAMNTCVRTIVLNRLSKLGLETLRLPIGASDQERHVPILVSSELARKERVIVLFAERNQDLGIFSYRTVGNDAINKGSAVNIVSSIMDRVGCTSGEEIPGIIVANPGQLLWYRGGGRAVSRTSWANLPRETAVDEPFRIDEVKNKVPGNEDFAAHVRYVFRHVIDDIVRRDARIDIIGLEWTGQACIKYLSENWDIYASRIGRICLGSPQHEVSDLGEGEFADFFGEHARAYFVSSNPVGTRIEGRLDYGCDCRASGEQLYPENIIVEGADDMLTWLGQLEI